jgi:hypothetical protein
MNKLTPEEITRMRLAIAALQAAVEEDDKATTQEERVRLAEEALEKYAHEVQGARNIAKTQLSELRLFLEMPTVPDNGMYLVRAALARYRSLEAATAVQPQIIGDLDETA